MSERSKVLDIGIGTGGEYIRQDSPNVFRIGLDIDPYGSLELLKERYGTTAIRADGSGDSPLSFSNKSFKQIDIVFPHDELLYGLCFSNFLWKEMNRVLIKSGAITIVVDVPWVGMQGITVKGENKLIDTPQYYIDEKARKNGFKTKITKLAPGDTRRYGTSMANSISQWQEAFPPTYVYSINARKIKGSL